MSALSVLLLLSFLDVYHQKAFTPGEKPQHKISYWYTGVCLLTYLFIYLSSYVSFRNPCGSHFQSGIALIPLWRKRAEMTHMGWRQKRGFSDLPCGCVDVVFGKSVKALQFGALWKQKRCEGM